MSIFKTFLAITKSNFMAIFIYLGVALAMCVALSLGGSQSAYSFESIKVKVAVIDEDESEVSRCLISYLEGEEDIVDASDDIDKLQDALFFGDIQYLLRIPEGFEEALENGEDVRLAVTSSPNSYMGSFVDMQVEGFINTFRSYKALGANIGEALDKTLNNLSLETGIETYLPDNSAKRTDSFRYFFYFAGYGIMTVLIHCIGSIMVVFNKTDMIKRMNCSSLPLKKRNLQIIIGNIVIMVAVFLLFAGIIFGFNHEEIKGNAVAPYLLMNIFMFSVFCMSVGYLVGTFAKHDGHIAIFSVSLSMVLSFLGGIFFPSEAFSSGMRLVSGFIPTTWYTSNVNLLYEMKSMTSEILPEFLRNIGVLAAFTVAVLSVAYSITARHAREAEA